MQLSEEELRQKLAYAYGEGVEFERDRILDVLRDAATEQHHAGDVDGAQILAEAVKLIEMIDGPTREEEVIETTVHGPGDPVEEMFTEENDEAKHDFDRALIGELPPERERPDDEVMGNLVKQVARRRS